MINLRQNTSSTIVTFIQMVMHGLVGEGAQKDPYNHIPKSRERVHSFISPNGFLSQKVKNYSSKRGKEKLQRRTLV